MELHDLDLNLLVVFNQLMVDKRVSIVAQSLGLTQPAVSNALRSACAPHCRTNSSCVPTKAWNLRPMLHI